jgi:hypothetical protein
METHNEIENETHLGLRNNRSSPIGLIEPITNLKLLRLFHEKSDEFVIDRFLYVNARAGGTVLAGVVEDTEGGPVRGLVEVRGLKNEVRGLAAEFEGNLKDT